MNEWNWPPQDPRDEREEKKACSRKEESEAQVGSNAGIKLGKREIENPGNQ